MRFIAVCLVVLVGVAHAGPTSKELIEKLSSKSAEERGRAAQQLGYLGKHAPERLDVLEKVATTDPDPTVRLRALEGLSPQYIDVTGPRWTALRVKMMKDADKKVRYEAVRQLRPAAKETFAAHFDVLKNDKDPGVRDLVILSLHDSKAPGLVEALIPLIEDKTIQRTVISTLGYENNAKAVPALKDAVKRQLPGAAGALANSPDPDAAVTILEAMEKSNADFRHEAVNALETARDGRAVPALLKLWSALGKADKKLSTKEQDDPMDDMNDFPHAITAALRAIADSDPAPCAAAKSATGETAAYLKKILPKKCGGGARTAEVEELLAKQRDQAKKLDEIYTADAAFSLLGVKDEPLAGRERMAAIVDGGKRGYQSVAIANDDKSAWIAVVITAGGVEWRVSELAVNTASGWRIAGGLASVGRDNKAVNGAAKARSLKLAALPAGKSEASLEKAFAALTNGPLDAAAAARAELVAFGSAPGERTDDGKTLARAWKAAWAKHITVDGPVLARVAPSGTTGFVVANVTLDKSAYKIPFRVAFVFDKVAAGWSLVHVQFATAAP